MKKLTVVMISFILILLAGCSSNNIQVKLSTPKTFTPGKAIALQIKVTDQDGKSIKGAKVNAKLSMKNMDHGTFPMTFDEVENGRYIGPADLPMDGDWVADITVDQDGKKSEFEKEFSIQTRSLDNAHKVDKKVALPDFNLIDESGKPVTKQNLLGKRVALTFTYVNCVDPNACPVLLGNFSKLQQDLKDNGVNTDDILLVSVSIDPENDTPEKLMEHAKKMNFDLSYLKMLTGDLNEVNKLTVALGEHFEKKGSEVIHDNKTFIFDQTGNLTHEFTGSLVDRQELFHIVSGGK
jgi:cytochrome oxidase Cu insertion factor (SCO1/SenC/PrrC family)